VLVTAAPACVGAAGPADQTDRPAALGGTLDPFQARLRIYAVYDVWNRHVSAEAPLPTDLRGVASRTEEWIAADGDAQLAYVTVRAARTPGDVRDPGAVYVFGPMAGGIPAVAVLSRTGPRFGVVEPRTALVRVIGAGELPAYRREIGAFGSNTA
jgi:hypothetical protein